MKLHQFTRELQAHQVEGDETTNEEYKTHDGSFSTYMRNKTVKLDTQAKENYSTKSQIFDKCVVYITGHTIPSAMELKRLIVENGGQICAFFSGKSYATHVIATSLTSRKIELFENIKVVKPAWVVESVKLGKLLDWSRYRTIRPVGNKFFSGSAAEENKVQSGNQHTEFVEPAVPGLEAMDPVVEQADQEEFLLDAPGPEGDAARKDWIVKSRLRVDCLHPNFISDYYANSRLHFLTTSKLKLRKLCRNYKSDFPLKNLPLRRTILHVDFDSFFVAVALLKRPHLQTKPVCVSHGSDGSDVASCNYVARKHGVANGMWVAKAKQVCPELICLPYDFEEYEKCSTHLYNTLLALKPLLISTISVDEAMIDVSNLVSDNQKSVDEICVQIRETVKNLTGIEVSVGVGSNILLAKLALRRAKPAGHFIMDNPSKVCEFEVRDLPGVGKYTQSQLLEEFNVRTVREMYEISLPDLQAKVGNVLGQRLYGYARGMDSSDITSLQVPIKSVGLDIAWGVRVITDAEKYEFIAKCTEELWSRLTTADAAMEVITVKIYVKSAGAPFVAPKHLGHGLCDIVSRSKNVLPRTNLEELKQIVKNLAQSIPCAALDFRGIGLHLKVSEQAAPQILPNQRLITDTSSNATSAARSGTTTPPVHRTMVAIPPRKRRRGMTLTQFVAPASQDNYGHSGTSGTGTGGGRGTRPYALGEIDMSVLAELPTQIRKEIMLNEDDLQVPDQPTIIQGPPLYKRSGFLDVYSPEGLRTVVRQWVQSSEAPTAEDAQSFCEYITAVGKEDSEWIAALELSEWFQRMVNSFAPHPDWLELCKIVDSQVQHAVKSRI